MGRMSFRARWVCGALALAGVPLPPAAAQDAPASGQVAANAPATPAARPEDVASMDAIVKAVYEVISGPEGQRRDWDRMRSLFIPGARLIPTRMGKDGVATARVLGVEDFVRMADPIMAKEGFFERESHRTVDRYGAIAQVFSTYESRHALTDARPFQRGINSLQLLFDGHRWWVVTIYWQAERDGLPVPEQYGG